MSNKPKESVLKKVLSIIVIIILVANLIFFGIGKINDLLFWVIIGLCAVSSFIIRKKL